MAKKIVSNKQNSLPKKFGRLLFMTFDPTNVKR